MRRQGGGRRELARRLPAKPPPPGNTAHTRSRKETLGRGRATSVATALPLVIGRLLGHVGVFSVPYCRNPRTAGRVLFALKVLNNYYHPGGSSNIMGINVSNKYACWVELIAIHLMNPGSSFVGHLAGILVGLMYTMGPLQSIMKACAGGLIFPTAFSQQRHRYNPEDYRYSGYTSYAPRDYNMYTGGLNEEEQYEWAIRNSLNDRGSTTRNYSNERRPYGFWLPPEEPSEEELRRQRLSRFERW